MTSSSLDALRSLADLPGVQTAVDEARDACTQLRWHQALRRRIPEAAAESRVRGATASALLEGAEPAGSRGTLALVRDLVRGAATWPDPAGPLDRTLRAAVQATAATEGLGAAPLDSAGQLLVRLHVAAATPLLDDSAQVGRPRRAGEDSHELADLGPGADPADLPHRLALLADLLGSVRWGASGVVVAALAHAEVATMRPFVRGNALVARALERVVLQASGVDPTGVAVPEAGHARGVGADYRGALGAYASGERDGVRLWLVQAAEAVVAGAEEGRRVADAVLAGRLSA